MSEKNNIIKSNTKNNFWYYTSFIFLFLVIIFTVWLHFYNKSINNDIVKIKMEISSIENNIKEENKDSNLEIYSLVKKNKAILDSYEKMNRINTFINHMNSIILKYRLKFIWFNISNWEIKTSVISTSDNKSISYQKVSDFITKYREDEKSLFDLAFINSFQWMDEIKFDINFKIK